MVLPRQKQVTFVVNATYPDVLKWLSRASIGLSTMVDEHFGINIVEFMVHLICYVLMQCSFFVARLLA